jgi:hypothetical protein
MEESARPVFDDKDIQNLGTLSSNGYLPGEYRPGRSGLSWRFVFRARRATSQPESTGVFVLLQQVLIKMASAGPPASGT